MKLLSYTVLAIVLGTVISFATFNYRTRNTYYPGAPCASAEEVGTLQGKTSKAGWPISYLKQDDCPNTDMYDEYRFKPQMLVLNTLAWWSITFVFLGMGAKIVGKKTAVPRSSRQS